MIPIKMSSAANTQHTATNTSKNLHAVFVLNNESDAVRGAGTYVLHAEDGDIRYFIDGNTPTTDYGLILYQGQQVVIFAPANKINYIRDGLTNVKINVQAGNAIVGGRS